jgi:hypothetical protein
VILLYAAVVALQQVQATATIDRRELEFGAEVVLTISVRATGNEPIRIVDPALDGLEVRGTSERSDVSVEVGVLTRVTTRTIRLAATRSGRVTIGAVRVIQAEVEVGTDPIELTVTGGGPAVAASLQPHIRSFVERRAPPPMAPDEVSVQVLTTHDRVVLGEQLDLVVLAWFPRAVRSRLRIPPTLLPPQLRGAWIYQQNAPGAVVVNRRVSGVTYDIYVYHEVVFPLTPGVLQIDPATVSYSLPVTYSFLSREVRHEPQSEPTQIEVLPQPSAGRPEHFEGTGAAELRFTVEVDPSRLKVGDAGTVVATLSGRGNVALWPEPTLAWPEGLNVYPENVEVELAPRDGQMAGTKVFRFLVVPDSVGIHSIQAPTYDYFDLDARQYVTLRLEAIEVVTEGDLPGLSERSQRPLPLADPPTFFDFARLAQGVPLWMWLIVAALLPALVALARRLERRQLRAREDAQATPSALQRLEREFHGALAELVPDADTRDARGLVDALRAVGVEAPVAAHAVRVRDRLWQASYGPEGGLDPTELAREVEEILRALTGARLSTERPVLVGAMALVVMTGALGQSLVQSPERLYEAGAFRSAADSFRVRAEQEPWFSGHWLNWGNSLYRLGEVSRARAVWLRAARLSPRNGQVREALELIPVTDGISRRLTWISPITQVEAFLAALAFWVSGWIAVWYRRRFALVLFAVAILLGGFGAYVRHEYAQPVALIAAADTPLRWAPYGTAPARRSLEQGSAVEVSRVEGQWVLAQRGDEQGWLRAAEIIGL